MDNPFQVTVYDKTFVRQGWITNPVYTSFTPRFNAQGSAEIQLAADDPILEFVLSAGARLRVEYLGVHLMSGRVRARQGGFVSSGTVTVQLLDDWALLSQTQAWVVPAAVTKSSGALAPTGLKDSGQERVAAQVGEGVWTTRTPPDNSAWLSVAWSPDLGIFCAVAFSGAGNRVMTSPDGVTWTSRTSAVAADSDWYSVAWSPELGIFCAVAESGTGARVMTSPDGITWTARTAAANSYWYSVAWSPQLGLFCAVANAGVGGQVMTSPDGITWTARTAAANSYWYSVVWSPELGIFCAVANNGTGARVMTSPDGITWTARTAAANNGWMSVAWSPELGLFCAVANFGTVDKVMTSPNGVTWTSRTTVDSDWMSVAWSPELGLFCAVASYGTGNRVMTSPDGITWTLRTSAADNYWRSVAWSPELGIFCATASSGVGNRVMTSSKAPTAAYYVWPDGSTFWGGPSIDTAETAIKHLVGINFNRLGRPVTIGADLGRGGNARAAAMLPQVRFGSLDTNLESLLEWSGLHLTLRQDPTLPTINLEVGVPAVWPQTLTVESGIILDGTWSTADPEATRTIVGGPDELGARAFWGINDATGLEAEYGDIIEVFRDATGATRNWPDTIPDFKELAKYYLLRPEVSAADKAIFSTYLDAAGAKALAEGSPTSGLSLELSETEVFHFGGTDGIQLGDTITATSRGLSFTDQITEATLSWDATDGLVVTPRVGTKTDDPDRQLAEAIASLARAQIRLSTSK
jgi:hypothetical protein